MEQGSVRYALQHYNPEMSLWGQEDAHETICNLIDGMQMENWFEQSVILVYYVCQDSYSYSHEYSLLITYCYG